MLLVYLLFLLYLSSSVCHATSRNHRLVFHGADEYAVVVPAASPSSTMAYGDHRTAMHVWRSPRRYVQAAPMTVEEQGGSPPPFVVVEGAPARTDQRDGAAMAPFPATDGGYIEVGGKEDSGGGGGDGGSSSSSEGGGGGDEQHEGEVDDTGIDYAPPKTHPPSHN